MSAVAGNRKMVKVRAVKENKKVKVGTEGVYAPFTFTDGSGKLTGYDVEVCGRNWEKGKFRYRVCSYALG